MAGNENLDPMDLGNLTFVDFSKIPISAGPVPGWDDEPEYDEMMKSLNTRIYECSRPIMFGTGVSHYKPLFYARIHALLGMSTERDSILAWESMGRRSERIAELLVADAMKTGKVLELPDALQGRCGALSEA